IQVDCPEDVATYIHRVGRTARYESGGRSILFLSPSETKMLEKLEEKKIPIRLLKANPKRLQPISGLLAALLVKYPNLLSLAQRAFVTYLRSIHKQHDRDLFDVAKLPVEEFSASLGLPMSPKVRFLKRNVKGSSSNKLVEEQPPPPPLLPGRTEEEEEEETGDIFYSGKGDDDRRHDDAGGEKTTQTVIDDSPGVRILKKKKLKINLNRPAGSRVVFDDVGNALPPLAGLAEMNPDSDSVKLDVDKVSERFAKLKEEMRAADREDKVVDRERRREKRIKLKMKLKRGREEEEEGEGGGGVCCGKKKKKKIYLESDDEEKKVVDASGISVAEQEEIALKLLNSMHS
ncbi:hypothetical protein M569_08087, partial [Genlisea aurea]